MLACATSERDGAAPAAGQAAPTRAHGASVHTWAVRPRQPTPIHPGPPSPPAPPPVSRLQVRTANGQAKPLSEVQLGERVLSVGADGALQYSPVYMWSSRRPAEAADFLLVRTDAGANLTGAVGAKRLALVGVGVGLWENGGGGRARGQRGLLQGRDGALKGGMGYCPMASLSPANALGPRHPPAGANC